jgi:hypothetical protein
LRIKEQETGLSLHVQDDDDYDDYDENALRRQHVSATGLSYLQVSLIKTFKQNT